MYVLGEVDETVRPASIPTRKGSIGQANEWDSH